MPGTHGVVGTTKQAKELGDKRSIGPNQMLSEKLSGYEGFGGRVLSREATWSDPGFPTMANLSVSRGLRKVLGE